MKQPFHHSNILKFLVCIAIITLVAFAVFSKPQPTDDERYQGLSAIETSLQDSLKNMDQ